ncbi:RWD domain containing protein 2B [Echinococcus multilocularis]|uniref:RWD domain containing protein 2B n=1 Tax=Echinococcus multilocularis TaxID=6211 RepID=A0A068YEB0_ECHMU|nr:RWD domain containing protein 2B [Echinococcus multilocularis]
MLSVHEKKAEIDLIRSVFTSDELVFSDPSLIGDLDLLAAQNLPIEDKDIDLTLKIAFSELSVIVDLSICLPIGYPQLRPSIVLRVKQSESVVNEKALNAAFQEWLDEVSNTAEPVICSVVDWLRSALNEEHWDAYLGRDAFKVAKSPPPSQPQLKSATPVDRDSATSPKTLSKRASQETEVCYWIFSHHIRNPKKRKVIVDWARESNLTGCCLPGKPGTVVIEGPEDKVEEYWKRIKVLTWKRIQVKDREVLTQRRFVDGFFEVGGTLSEKIGYMREHGVSQERIAAHFGFKVDEPFLNTKQHT